MKNAYDLTLKEFHREQRKIRPSQSIDVSKKLHKNILESTIIILGKTISDEILKDYPTLLDEINKYL